MGLCFSEELTKKPNKNVDETRQNTNNNPINIVGDSINEGVVLICVHMLDTMADASSSASSRNQM